MQAVHGPRSGVGGYQRWEFWALWLRSKEAGSGLAQGPWVRWTAHPVGRILSEGDAPWEFSSSEKEKRG